VSRGLDALKHIVVLMMSGRSFDHMLGGLKSQDARIDGLTGSESNPDSNGALVRAQPLAVFQGQLQPSPDTHFPGVDLQIFGGVPPGPGRVANMQGFVKNYFLQSRDVERSQNVMYFFTPDKLPVLTSLAMEYGVFNGWFSSVPGPTICNRAFAHYGTSFGQVGTSNFYVTDSSILSLPERLVKARRSAKIYYYDLQSPPIAVVSLSKNQPRIFASFDQFLADCKNGTLPDYSFIEPNHIDHTSEEGAEIASDQHPDHHIQHGEIFIASVYNAIFNNPDLWRSTALLIVYDNNGGIYDHVVPPACETDGYTAPAESTGTGAPFAFDRLGVRVPAVLVSPWIPKGTVISGPEVPAGGRIFDHASIPATVTNFFIEGRVKRTMREQNAKTFLDVLSDQLRPDDELPFFQVS